MTFDTLQHGHTRQRGPEQACTHTSAVRHAFRPAGNRRQHSKGSLCVCLGLLDRFTGSSKIREKDLVQMGPLKVSWHAVQATASIPPCCGVIANASMSVHVQTVVTKLHRYSSQLMHTTGQPDGVRHMGLGQPIPLGCAKDCSKDVHIMNVCPALSNWVAFTRCLYS